jgi:hypothetical protein
MAALRKTPTMPLKTIAIKFTDPDVPFETASNLLSHLAHPGDPVRQASLSNCLCRAEHCAESDRNPAWQLSPQRMRPQIFAMSDDAYAGDLHYGMRTLSNRFDAALNMLIQHIDSFVYDDLPKDLPTLQNSIDGILKHRKKSIGTRKTYIKREWTPTKPVVHLAFAYGFMVFLKPNINNTAWLNLPFKEKLSPYPKLTMIYNVLKMAEIIRSVLPELLLGFNENDTIQFVADT